MGLSRIKIAATLLERLQSKIVDSYRLWPHARIDGVEVTQAIQHYRAADHLADPHDRGIDNSVFLVAGKAAWVRVYVRSGVRESVSGATGTLHVERRRHGSIYDHVRTVSPERPGSVTAYETMDYATERGNVANSLNFVIRPEEFYGFMRLTVRLTDGAGRESDTLTFEVNTPVRQTLRLRAILVNYNGPATSARPGPGQPPPPNLPLAAPTLADLQATAGLAMRAMPVQSTGSFTSGGTIPWDQPLDDPRSGPGLCSLNWDALLERLAVARAFDGNRPDVVYYGCLPARIPRGVPGCGARAGGLGSGVVHLTTGDQPTLLHEIGHGYGFEHTPCGSAGDTDPRYPTYEPYPSASIGEYGLDISNGNMFSPQTTSDYMSYCPLRWMSLYQHNRLWLHTRLDPSFVVTDEYLIDPPYEEPVIPDFDRPSPPEYKLNRSVDMKANPIVSITGVVRSSEEVEVNTVARVMAAASPLGTRTRLTAQLVGDTGEPVARGQLFRLDAHGGCGCGNEGGDPGTPPYAFQAFVPDVEPGTALRIVEGEREIWSRRAPERPPEVEHLEVGVTEDQQLELHWHAQTVGEEPEAWAQWSADRGESWQGLAGNLTGDAAMVGLAGLPDGEILVRVLVLDGFFTSSSEPVRVEVPARPPEAAILHPAEGQRLYSDRTLHLWAEATDPAGEPLPDWSCRWMLDDREVARGKQAWLTTPAPGEHRATLVVQAFGREVVQSVRFITVGDMPR
jgi:hypothetical protein